MIFKPKELKSSHIDSFKRRMRIFLALKNVEITDKCLEVLYWIIHFSESEKIYKNSHQIHKDAAKKIGTYPSYIGSYSREHLESKGYLKREEFIPAGIGARKVIKGYKVPDWIMNLYNNPTLKMELIISYE